MRRLADTATEHGQGPVAVLKRAVRDVLPIAARVDHPRFFAFVPSAPTWPGVIADYLMSYRTTWDDVRETIERISEFGREFSRS